MHLACNTDRRITGSQRRIREKLRSKEKREEKRSEVYKDVFGIGRCTFVNDI